MTRGALAAMLAHARDDWPREACGLLLGGEGGVITLACAAANHAPDPARHFAIDPAALIAAHRQARGGGPAVLGYYHSHPSGDSRPSATDRAQAPHDGLVWAIIATGPRADASAPVQFWRDMPSGFEALSTRLVDD